MEEQVQREAREEERASPLALVEAALYVSGRPLDLKTIGSILGTRSKRRAKDLARALVEKYGKTKGALEILELQDERFVMQLRKDYLPGVKRLSIRPLLSRATQQTLAYIAYRQPVAQSHVALVRGGSVYGQIRELKKLGLISTERLGKTQILKTTDTFSDYFNLSHNPRLMRRQLMAIFNDTRKNGGETEGAEADLEAE